MTSRRTRRFAGLLLAAFGLMPGCGDESSGPGAGGPAAGGTACAGTGTLTFGRLPLVAVEFTAAALALDDLDGDGATDLVVSTTNSDGTLVAYRGQGDGTFGPPASVPLPGWSHDLVTGDVSGDGKPDAVVVVTTEIVDGKEARLLAVLQGLGDGSFAPAETIEIAALPQRVVLADLDADGDLDIAASAQPPDAAMDELHVLLNQGGGSFAPSVAYGTGYFAQGVAAGDFDGDGKVDLAVANGNGGDVSLYVGSGDGSFAQAVSVPSDPYQNGIATADFNGDGKLDLAVTTSDGFVALVNAGGGAFAAPVAVSLFEVQDPGRIAVADVNDDGKVDVVVTEENHRAHVARGNGDGTFSKLGEAFVGSKPSALGLAHLDGDSKLDLVVAAGGSTTVAPLLGNGDGTFDSFATHPAVEKVLALSAGDFNNDKKVDFAVANLDEGSTVLLGQPGGAFTPTGPLAVSQGQYRLPLEAADFDGDGNLDLVAGQAWGVTVLPGTGDGQLGTGPLYGEGSTDQVLVEDADADGKLDIITVEVSASAAVRVLRNDVSGVFSVGEPYPAADSSEYHAPARATAGDFDGDGVRDLVVASRLALAFFRGQGDGTYAPAPSVPSPLEQPGDVVAADFNGDGHLDIAIGSFYDVVFGFGDGKGGFAIGEANRWFGLSVSAMAVADLDQNGRPDLVIASAENDNLVDSAQSGEIFILRGQDDGTMSGPERFLAGWQAEDVAIVDINGDGRLDIATVDSTSGTANVLLGGCIP